MLKRAVLFLCAGFMAALPVRTAAQQKVTVDKVIAVVGNSGILYSDVYELRDNLIKYGKRIGYSGERNPMSQALETLLTEKLLYQQALIDSVSMSGDRIAEFVESRVKEMTEEVGSMAELEKQYGQPIFDIKKDLTRQYEEEAYAEDMRSTITGKVRITPGEVSRFYKNLPEENLPIIPEQYVYAQIVKYPENMEEAKFKARETLLGYKERIQNGEMTFDVIARLYSQDEETRRLGGELPAMPLMAFDPKIAGAIENLRPGQMSDVVENAYGFQLLQLVSKEGSEYKVKLILRHPEYTNEELSRTDAILDSLTRLIRLDSLTFAKAAELYSDDKYSKMNGGLVSNLEMLEKRYNMAASYATTRHLTENLSPQDIVTLRELKPGEISQPFGATDMSGNTLRKIIKLIEIVPAHTANLKDDYIALEQAALAEKQAEEFNNWLTRKIMSMYVRIDPEFSFDDFDNMSWFK